LARIHKRTALEKGYWCCSQSTLLSGGAAIGGPYLDCAEINICNEREKRGP